MKKLIIIGLMSLLGFSVVIPAAVADDNMSFFVTSEGSGKGGDLGGLVGADAHCATLAKAAGSKKQSGKLILVPKQKASVESVRVTESVKDLGITPKVY